MHCDGQPCGQNRVLEAGFFGAGRLCCEGFQVRGHLLEPDSAVGTHESGASKKCKALNVMLPRIRLCRRLTGGKVSSAARYREWAQPPTTSMREQTEELNLIAGP